MKFTINREELSRALRVVSGIVERKHQQSQILSSAFLTTGEDGRLKVVTTDQEIELMVMIQTTVVAKEGATLISCRKLNDICRVLPDGVEINIDSTSEKTLIKAGQSKFVLSSLPVDQFPRISDVVARFTLSISRVVFTKLLEKTAFAMADQDVRYFLNGMLLEVNTGFLSVVAADGHRLAMQTIPFTGANIVPSKIIIPRKGILEILRVLGASKVDTINLIFGITHFQVICDDMSVTTVLIGGKYPDYDKLIQRNGDKIVHGHREQLKEAIYRASALLTEKFKGVRLRFSKGWMQILAYNTEKDEVEENLAVDFNGADVELGFNAKYLLDFLSSGGAEKVKMTFSDPNGSVLLEELDDSQGLCIVMPMRV